MKELTQPLMYGLACFFGVTLLLAIVGRVPLKYNLRNLVVRWPTTLMTAIAFTLVTALLVVMLSFVNGMYAVTESSGQPGNVIVLSEGSTDETFSNLGMTDVGDIENQPGVLRQSDRPLSSRETYLIVTQPIENPTPGGPRRQFLQIRGVDDPPVSGWVHGLALFPGGQWFSQAGFRKLPDGRELLEVVLGDGIASQLGKMRRKKRLDVGDELLVGEMNSIVVGVMDSSGTTFDSEVWAKRSYIGPKLGKETYTSLVLRAESGPAALRLRDFFAKDYQKASVLPYVESEYYAGLSQTNQQFLWATAVVALIMAIGGTAGILNTMFAAVSQRTKDIGVLRLLGFSRWQILVSFVLEAIVIALIGSALGCALGSLCHGQSMNSVVTAGRGGGKSVVFQMVVDLHTLGTTFFVAVLMGVLGGLIPALDAVRQRALDALR